jgi:hypothetical protein
MAHTSEQCLEKAADCRLRARTESGKARELLLEMAGYWETLANQAADRQSKKVLQ